MIRSLLLSSVNMSAFPMAPPLDEQYFTLTDLTGWEVANMSVDSGFLVSDSTANPTVAYYPFDVAADETALITCEMVVGATSSGFCIWGINTRPGGPVATSGAPYLAAAGINGNNAGSYYGGSVGGTKDLAIFGDMLNNNTSITIAIELDSISISARNSVNHLEQTVSIDRSTMNNGGVVTSFGCFHNGAGGITNTRFHKVRAKRPLEAFSSDVENGINYATPVTIHRHIEDEFRFLVPPGIKKGDPLTLILSCHQAGGDIYTPYFDNEQVDYYDALTNAGFANCSATAVTSNHWSTETALDHYETMVNWINGIYPITNLILQGISMGGLIALNMVHRGNVPNIKGVYNICGVASFDDIYPGFSSAINSAWGVSNLAGLQAVYGGYNPVDELASSYTANCMNYRFSYGTNDSIVPHNLHSDVMISKLVGTATEATALSKTNNGHLAVDQYDTADMISFIGRVT